MRELVYKVSSGNQLRQARRSLNILFQEWGNRGLHYWQIGNNSITLVADQAVYTMFRSTGDGTSDATAIYGVDDVLEAVYRNFIKCRYTTYKN